MLAFEPNPPSFALAQKNLAPYGTRVGLSQKGLWSRATARGLSDDFLGARLQSGAGQYRVECTDLTALMQEYRVEVLDVVKLDVEHAELEIILENSDDWLSRTRWLIVEFHTPAIREKCTARLNEKGFHGFAYRDVYYFFNPRLME